MAVPDDDEALDDDEAALDEAVDDAADEPLVAPATAPEIEAVAIVAPLTSLPNPYAMPAEVLVGVVCGPE